MPLNDEMLNEKQKRFLKEEGIEELVEEAGPELRPRPYSKARENAYKAFINGEFSPESLRKLADALERLPDLI